MGAAAAAGSSRIKTPLRKLLPALCAFALMEMRSNLDDGAAAYKRH